MCVTCWNYSTEEDDEKIKARFLFLSSPRPLVSTMEAQLLPGPSSKTPPSSHFLTLTRSANPFSLAHFTQSSRSHRHYRPLKLTAAISRTKKEETVETVQKQLENCYLLAGIKYKGFSVKQFQELRRSLPETTSLIVAKNTLVYKAIEGTPWEALKPCMKGMNAWLFIHSEEIPVAIKPYRDFQKEKKFEDNDFTGAVFEGKFYGPTDFKELETMPSRAEIYAKLLGSLKSPASSLVGTIQAPAREVVMVLKAYVQKLEQENGGGGQ